GEEAGHRPGVGPTGRAEALRADLQREAVVHRRSRRAVVDQRREDRVQRHRHRSAARGRTLGRLDRDDGGRWQGRAVARRQAEEEERRPTHRSSPRIPTENTPPPGRASRWSVLTFVSAPRTSRYGSTAPRLNPPPP